MSINELLYEINKLMLEFYFCIKIFSFSFTPYDKFKLDNGFRRLSNIHHGIPIEPYYDPSWQFLLIIKQELYYMNVQLHMFSKAVRSIAIGKIIIYELSNMLDQILTCEMKDKDVDDWRTCFVNRHMFTKIGASICPDVCQFVICLRTYGQTYLIYYIITKFFFVRTVKGISWSGIRSFNFSFRQQSTLPLHHGELRLQCVYGSDKFNLE